MARLSTGQAYGEAARASAAQLLGGIPVDASGGALAQGSINAPSLQPRATPVDTFQRVGAPTLGGAPKFFAPPDLPNPGQDLANLSRALGGFSTTLQSFGETWLANKQQEDKRQEAATGALVGQASRFGPARGIADLAANLEKAAALGNPDAARMLQVVREKQNNSVGKYWLERSVEQNAIQGAALSLPDRIANTSMIKGADGRDVELNTLSSDDPRYLQYRDELLFGSGQMSPQGYAKNQGIIVQAQLQADQAQRKRFNTAEAGRLTAQVGVNRQSIATDYISVRGKGDADGAIRYVGQALQQQIDSIRILGMPEETKTELINKYLEGFSADVVSAARSQGLAITDMDAVLKPALRSVMTGPIDQRVKADGTPNQALRLYNTLGGEAFLDQVVAKANAAQIQDNTQQSQMAGIQEQQSYDARLNAALPEGRRSDPAAIKGFFQAERERAAVEPDGIKRAAMFSQLDASERQLTETFVKPVQEQRALWYAQQLGQTAGDEAARNRLQAQLQADLAADRISNTTAISIQTTLSAQGSKEVRTYDKDINKRITDKTKEWELYIGSPKSYGDSTVTSFESQALYKFRDDARRRSYDVVYQAIKEGKDPTEALNKLWTNSNFGLRRREDVGGTQAPMYENGSQLMQKNTGNWSRSTIAPRDANNLRGQSKVRPLYGAEAFATDVDALLNGAPSQNFRTLLKTLTTGAGGQKPSEVILNQFRLQNIEVPEDVRQRIQALDGQEISRAPAPRRATPQQNQALAGIQIVGGALGNLLVPPAQAGPTASAVSSAVPQNLQTLSRMIGGVESFGGSYNAFNRGGSNGGTVARGSGIDRNLSNMTIAEIQRRQLTPGIPADQKLHATGKYQIIGITLRSLMAGKYGPTGVKPTDRYTPAVQERLFAALAQNRLVPGDVSASMKGLRQEWVGLRKVPDSQLRPVVESLLRSGSTGRRSSAEPNEELGSQFTAQLEAQGGYEDTAGPAVQRKPWAGEAGQFASKGSFQNGLDAINKSGASVMGFLAGKPNDIELVTRFYSKNPEVANQYDLPVNLFVRYISGLGAKGLQVSQEQGRSVLESIRTRRMDSPEHISWFEKNHPAWAVFYKRNIAKGMIPVDSFARGNFEIGNSLGRFWATPQKDGSYLITEDFNFDYAPKAQGGNDKRAKLSRAGLQAVSINPMQQANRLVTRGFGKPFRYTLRISPDGRVQVNP